MDEVFITAGHLGGQIHDYVSTLRGGREPCPDTGGAAPALLPRIHVAVEAAPRGTAGAVADLLPRLRSPFAVLSGDAVLDIDLAKVTEAHVSGGHVATICLAPPDERLRFGTVATRDQRIVRFLEKPALADLVPGLGLNTGCYVLSAAALEGVRTEGPVDFAYDVFPRLLQAGAALGACPGARFWRDIGTLEAYRETHFEGLRGGLPWPLPASRAGDEASSDSEAGVHYGNDVSVGPGARIAGPAVIGDGCHIGAGAFVSRSVLLAGSRVGRGASLVDSVLDEEAEVPAGWRLAQAGVGAAAAEAPRPAVLEEVPLPARRDAASAAARLAGARSR